MYPLFPCVVDFSGTIYLNAVCCIIWEMVFLRISVPESRRRQVCHWNTCILPEQNSKPPVWHSDALITAVLWHSHKNLINLHNKFSEHAKRQKDTHFSVMNNKVTLRNGMTQDKLMFSVIMFVVFPLLFWPNHSKVTGYIPFTGQHLVNRYGAKKSGLSVRGIWPFQC